MTDIHTISLAEIKPRGRFLKSFRNLLIFLEINDINKTIYLASMKNASDICDELLLKFERWEKW